MDPTCQSTDSTFTHVSSTGTTGDSESCLPDSRETCQRLQTGALCPPSIDYKWSSTNNSSDSLIVPSSTGDGKQVPPSDTSLPHFTVHLPLSTCPVSKRVFETPDFSMKRSTSSSQTASLEMISTASLEACHYASPDETVDIHLLIFFTFDS